MSFPRIPVLARQQPGETAEAFGLRAFCYLVTEGVPVGLLDREQQASALHFSLVAVTAPDVADAVRARWHAVRHQLAQALAQPVVAETAPPAAPAARQSTNLPGGARVPRPVPPTPQRPPSAAVSLVSGKPLPSPAEAAARIAAVQQRVRAALPALAAVAQEDAL
jgi:hypothetical protein